MKIKAIPLILITLTSLLSFSFTDTKETETINWISIEEAEAQLKKTPNKKVFVDLYTHWCGWCKKMDATTFHDPRIVKYMNEKYLAVKLNAETKEQIIYKGDTLTNPGRTHQVVKPITNGKLTGYPTVAFLDENLNVLTVISSYLKVEQLDPILHYFGDNKYHNTSWEIFSKEYEPEK